VNVLQANGEQGKSKGGNDQKVLPERQYVLSVDGLVQDIHPISQGQYVRQWLQNRRQEKYRHKQAAKEDH